MQNQFWFSEVPSIFSHSAVVSRRPEAASFGGSRRPNQTCWYYTRFLFSGRMSDFCKNASRHLTSEIYPSDNLLKPCLICRKTSSEFATVTILFCREGSLAMFSWMSKDEARVKHGDIYEGVAEGLKGIYKWGGRTFQYILYYISQKLPFPKNAWHLSSCCPIYSSCLSYML